MNKQQIIDKFRTTISSIKKSKAKSVAMLLVILLAIPFTVYLVKQITKYISEAALDTTNVFFSPESANIEAGQELSFFLMSDFGNNNVSFVRTTLTYDPTLLTITNFVPSDTISDIIELTPLETANTNGSLTIVYIIPPQETSLTDIAEIAHFNVVSNTTQENISASISVNSDDSQFVDNTEAATPITSNPLNLVLNYVAPSNTSTQTPTQTVTQTPFLSPTIFTSPTPTQVQPSLTPTDKGTCECRGSKIKTDNCSSNYAPYCTSNNECSCI